MKFYFVDGSDIIRCLVSDEVRSISSIQDVISKLRSSYNVPVFINEFLDLLGTLWLKRRLKVDDYKVGLAVKQLASELADCEFFIWKESSFSSKETAEFVYCALRAYLDDSDPLEGRYDVHNVNNVWFSHCVITPKPNMHFGTWYASASGDFAVFPRGVGGFYVKNGSRFFFVLENKALEVTNDDW